MAVHEIVALWGDEHTNLGEIAVESVQDRAAIALSRGRHPKWYYSKEENEDAVVAIAGERATVLVAGDGHAGFETTRAAVATVVESIGDDPPPADLSDADLLDLFSSTNEAALRAAGGGEPAAKPSRTTLVLALVAGPRLQWASFGDSEIFVGNAEAVRSLGSPKLQFIGYSMDREHLSGLLDRGTVELGTDHWVIAATDGLTNFLGGAGEGAGINDSIAGILSSGLDPAGVAEQLVRGAFDGGAGDNVAVAATRVAG